MCKSRFSPFNMFSFNFFKTRISTSVSLFPLIPSCLAFLLMEFQYWKRILQVTRKGLFEC